jgi:hypothetical protein
VPSVRDREAGYSSSTESGAGVVTWKNEPGTFSEQMGSGEMLKHCVTAMLALLFTLFAPRAHTFFDPPYITPASPIAGQTISVNIRGGVCDSILYIPGYPQISQQSNAIRILFFGVRYTDPILCNIGVGTATFPVSAYPAGAYTLRVDLYYFDMNGDDTVDTLGIVPFTVAGAPSPAIAAPTLSTLGLSALALIVMGCAGWAMRKRRMSVFLPLLSCLSFHVDRSRFVDTSSCGRTIRPDAQRHVDPGTARAEQRRAE